MALQLLGRPVHKLVDQVRGEAQGGYDALVEHSDTVGGHRPHGQLLLARRPHLADGHDTQGRAQHAGYSGAHGDPAPGHGDDYGSGSPDRAQATGNVLAEHLARLDAVNERSDRTRPAGGQRPSLSLSLFGVDHDPAVVFGVVAHGDALAHLHPGAVLRGGESDPGCHLERLRPFGLDP